MIPFYGIEDVRVRATPTGFEPQLLRVWFHTRNIVDITVLTTGGFSVTLMP